MLPLHITEAGESLIASTLGGESGILFTRICTSSSELLSDALDEITALDIKQSAPISGISRNGNNCEVFAVTDNSGLSEGYFIRALGLFAQSEDEEILFGVCVEGADAFYMPAGGVNSRTEVTLRIALSAEDSENVLLIPDTGAYASAVHLREEISRLEGRIDALDFDDAILRKITEHDQNKEAHGELLAENGITGAEANALKARVLALETVLQCAISSNPFAAVFSDLEGLCVNGVWNTEKSRIEF